MLTGFCPTVSSVNLGGLLLQALLEFWPRTRINPMDEEENEVNHGKEALNCQIIRNSGNTSVRVFIAPLCIFNHLAALSTSFPAGV